MGCHLRCTGLLQNAVVCVAGNLFFYFLYGIDAGNLGRTVLFPRSSVHPAAIAGGYHDIHPCDPAESTGHGKVDRPGSTGSDYSGSLYVYLFRTEWLLLV